MFGQNLKRAVFPNLSTQAQGTNDVKVTYLQTLVVRQFCHSPEKHDSIMTKTNKSEEFVEVKPKGHQRSYFFSVEHGFVKVLLRLQSH